jgi:hypothetical protein
VHRGNHGDDFRRQAAHEAEGAPGDDAGVAVPGVGDDHTNQFGMRFHFRFPFKQTVDAFRQLPGVTRVPRSGDRGGTNVHAGILGVSFRNGEFLLEREGNLSEQKQKRKADDAHVHKQKHREQQSLARMNGTNRFKKLWTRGRWFLGRSFREEQMLPEIIHACTS